METRRYKLTKTELRDGAFLYQVIDTMNGDVLKTRKSRRTYVAATVFDNYFYGRRDLVFTGDRIRQIKDYRKSLEKATSADQKAKCRKRLAELDTIAFMDTQD